jgi:cytochrome c oxidase subunit 3
MSMPYANDVRPDTGLYNAKLGLWFFLAAEAMFFGALFSSYAFLRTASEAWPDGSAILPVGIAVAACATAILSAAAAARAWSDVKRSGAMPAAALWAVTLAGFATAGLIGLSFGIESGEGMRPATNTFYACWYLIAGLIAAHATGGGAYALYLLWPGGQPDPLALRNRVECLGLFWQFIALVWLAAFACFYVL